MVKELKDLKLVCTECGQEDEYPGVYYNPYNKSEAQIRNGYKCSDCKKSARKKYNRRRY